MLSPVEGKEGSQGIALELMLSPVEDKEGSQGIALELMDERALCKS